MITIKIVMYVALMGSGVFSIHEPAVGFVDLQECYNQGILMQTEGQIRSYVCVQYVSEPTEDDDDGEEGHRG